MGAQALFTTQQVANELSISDAYLRQLIAAGKAHPAQRIGNSWVFDKQEVDRLRNRPKNRGGRPKKQ